MLEMKGICRKAVQALVLACVFGANAEGRRNLVTNFDHRERMGVDLPMGWAKHIKDKVMQQRL